jgi:adenylate cyclase
MRRFAAILSVDAPHGAAMRETLSRFRGRVVDGPGDILLAEFASVVDAVECAVTIQRLLSERKPALPVGKHLEFRIGVSLGDVLVDGERISGEALDVAAQLRRLAEPGGIVISETAYEQVETKLPYRYEVLGEHTVKEMAGARRVYRVIAGDLPAAVHHTSAGSLRARWHGARQPSIAVLPFREYDIREGRSYFADGIVDDIVGALASLPDLFVISRSSTLSFRGANTDVRAAATTLGVQYVLSGSVRRGAEKIRTVTELCDTETGGILWTDSVEGSLNDVFAFQDRLSERVVATIAPQVRQAELHRALRKRPESLDAYDFVLRGLDLLYRLRREEFEQARGMFQRAIDLDPAYATPYALSANWYSIRIGQGWSENLAEDIDAVHRLATATLERDPFDPRALALCGHVRAFVFRDHEGAMALFHRAIAAGPNSSEAWVWSSPTYSYIGDGAEAARRAEHSLRLSPLDPHVFLNRTALALAHYTSGNFDGAATWARMATAENPRYTAVQRILIASLAAAGRLDEARSVARVLLDQEPAFRVEAFCRAHPYKDPVRREMLARHLRAAGLPD